MYGINEIFDRLDHWRRFPGYQLERRADIFFGIYLADVLARYLGPIRGVIVPEFPVKQEGSHLSDKIDYVCVSGDGKRMILVELKTDIMSHRVGQVGYLTRARDQGPAKLLAGLQEIIKVSRSSKYPALIGELQELQVWGLGASELPQSCQLVFVQPTQWLDEKIREQLAGARVRPTIIDFGMFADVVEATPGALSARFAKSLRSWGDAAKRENE